MDPVGRTVEWIAQSPFLEPSQVESTDVACTRPPRSVFQSDLDRSVRDHASGLSMASDFHPVIDTNSSGDVSHMDGQTAGCGVDTLTYTQMDGQTVITQPVNTSHSQSAVTVASVTQPENPCLSTQVRSRFGRIIKPVDRLIQTMSRQEIVHTHLSMQAVCRSVFFVIR